MRTLYARRTYMGFNSFREEEFLERMQNLGIKTERCRHVFLLKGGVKYTPDFYIPIVNTYIEVIGTRQAFQQNKAKYQEAVNFLGINIWFVTPNFSDRKPLFASTRKLQPCKYQPCGRLANSAERFGGYCPEHSGNMKNLALPLELWLTNQDVVLRDVFIPLSLRGIATYITINNTEVNNFDQPNAKGIL